MTEKSFKQLLILLFLLSFCVTAHSSESVITKTILKADFNDLTPGDSLGEGGAIVGEPIDFDLLDNEVIEDMPGENYLRISNASGLTTPMNVVWQFLDDEEVTNHLLTIAFKFTPTTLDKYSFQVRENGDTNKDFLTVIYDESGTFSASDAAGNISLTNNSFTANTEQDISIEFNMESGTSHMMINGELLFTGRNHGISDRGVGSLLTGYADFNNTTPFLLDDISVIKTIPLSLVLDADLEDKPLGNALGNGGAVINEPELISDDLMTEIIEFGTDNKAVLVDNPTSGVGVIRWEFLDNIEIQEGFISIETDLYFNQLDDYRLYIRESSTSASSFSTVRFFSNGNITLTDSTGFAGTIGTYQAEQLHKFKTIYHLDNDSYSVWLDDELLIEDRLHGVTSGDGIGAFLMGFQPSASADASFVADDIKVGVSNNPFIIFNNGFE
ncbi:hypothetical protein ACFODZ_03795 [Marinicella sediminis]|uniref:LamG domain-containing protein n=1 Tax=Marinicella sediminis TaxID=1792834 RepID=A0ABV7JD73_9GAMM|nr:hypothetical protein [Marinicella sediminis]